MGHYSLATVTDAGNVMLNEMMAGQFITVTRAEAGAGTVPGLEELRALTALTGGKKQDLSIIDDRISGQGRTIAIQVTNAEETYPMNQIGVFARLGDDGAETLLYIMQEDPDEQAPEPVGGKLQPIWVPDTSAPPFNLDVYTHLNINNETGRFIVEIDAAGVVNVELLTSKLEEHNTDKYSHLIPDDNNPGNLFRLGIEDGHLYAVEVSEIE